MSQKQDQDGLKDALQRSCSCISANDKSKALFHLINSSPLWTAGRERTEKTGKAHVLQFYSVTQISHAGTRFPKFQAHVSFVCPRVPKHYTLQITLITYSLHPYNKLPYSSQFLNTNLMMISCASFSNINDETAYREEVRLLAEICLENNLFLNVSKTKELVMDFRKQNAAHSSNYIGGYAVERISSFRFLGVTLTASLKFTEHAAAVTKKAHQRLYFLRRLKKARMSTSVLTSFYRCAVESILMGNITSWYGGCTAQDKEALQKVVKTAQRIIGTPLSVIMDIYITCCL